MIELNLNPNDDIQNVLSNYPLDEVITLYLSPGHYHQKLVINHRHLSIIGDKDKETMISFNNYSYKMHEDGLLYNTFRTSTVTVLSEHVTFKHIRIANTAGHGLTIGQAVALSVYGTNFKAIDCQLIGYQDTLFIGPLPVDLTIRYDDFLPLSYRQTDPVIASFHHSMIEGDVDFIFGSGMALFNDCDIIGVDKGYIFAPSTYQSFPYGMIVLNSRVVAKHELYIARPWREYGQVHLIHCSFEGPIHPDRYTTWDKTHYTFKELPYVNSPYTSPLSDNELIDLKQFIQYTFDVKI